MRLRIPGSRWAVVLALASSACGAKENVSLSASVSDASVEVRAFPLGTQLAGGFTLRLELGAEAPGGTQVSLGAFSLRRDQTEIVSGVPVVPAAGVTFPLGLGKGEVKNVAFTLDSTSLLEAARRDAICLGPLVIAGTVSDSASGQSTGASSPSVAPSCPVD